MKLPREFENRHPATLHIFQYFAYDHLPEPLKTNAMYSYQLAVAMATELPDGPELTAGLRKLMEARDCFVRCAIPLMPKADHDWPDEDPPIPAQNSTVD